MPDINGWYESRAPGIRAGDDAIIITEGPPHTYVDGSDVPLVPTPGPSDPVPFPVFEPSAAIPAETFTEANPLWGFPGKTVVVDNKLYYAADNYTIGSDLPVIRTWDGQSDEELCQVPRDAAGTIPLAITSMIVAPINGRDRIILATWDGGLTDTTAFGRVLVLNPGNGATTVIGTSQFQGLGHVPWSLHYSDGRLWVGTHRISTAAGLIAYNNLTTGPGETITSPWTLALDLTGTGQGGVVSLAKPQTGPGVVFGTCAPAGTFAVVAVLRLGGGVTGTLLTGSGGVARDYNGFYALQNFYLQNSGSPTQVAGFWNPDTVPVSKIYTIFDTGALPATTSTVYTDTTGNQIVRLFLDGPDFVLEGGFIVTTATLYAIGARRQDGIYSGFVAFTRDNESLTDWEDVTERLPMSYTGIDPDAEPDAPFLTLGVTMSDRAFSNNVGSISF